MSCVFFALRVVERLDEYSLRVATLGHEKSVIAKEVSTMSQAIALSPHVIDDSAAIARGLKAHDPELINALIERHQHRSLRYLTYLTGNRDDAEDLFQELWLRVLRSGSSCNGSASFEGWLAAIARNLIIDFHRRRRPTSLDALRSGEDGDWSFDVADCSPSPFDLVRSRESVEKFETAFDALLEEQQKVLKLRFCDELELNEIARLIQTPLSTVKSRLYRGIAALRKQS